MELETVVESPTEIDLLRGENEDDAMESLLQLGDDLDLEVDMQGKSINHIDKNQEVEQDASISGDDIELKSNKPILLVKKKVATIFDSDSDVETTSSLKKDQTDLITTTTPQKTSRVSKIIDSDSDDEDLPVTNRNKNDSIDSDSDEKSSNKSTHNKKTLVKKSTKKVSAIIDSDDSDDDNGIKEPLENLTKKSGAKDLLCGVSAFY